MTDPSKTTMLVGTPASKMEKEFLKEVNLIEGTVEMDQLWSQKFSGGKVLKTTYEQLTYSCLLQNFRENNTLFHSVILCLCYPQKGL